IAQALADELADAGYPLFLAAQTTAPFDLFADYYRGSKEAMLDMYRRPDLLLEAMEKARILLIRDAISACESKAGDHVFIPLHWGLDNFMSPEQFETFFWPQLRQMIFDLIDADLVPFVFWEGECGKRLETIGDIPKGKAIYKFEQTDLFRAKEVLGDTVCIQGNVPASLFNTAQPEEMDAFCRKLIEGVAPGGGFILDGAVSIPDEAKYENVVAYAEAARKYGS
ncbi:MAG: uroporphyrinogen decarboxylase family protein, partial [Rhodospirillales bacterium]|nr:uroporphyrinogen decarboxylase family protein [Rhodospirillales bacterium]